MSGGFRQPHDKRKGWVYDLVDLAALGLQSQQGHSGSLG